MTTLTDCKQTLQEGYTTVHVDRTTVHVDRTLYGIAQNLCKEIILLHFNDFLVFNRKQ